MNSSSIQINRIVISTNYINSFKLYQVHNAVNFTCDKINFTI